MCPTTESVTESADDSPAERPDEPDAATADSRRVDFSLAGVREGYVEGVPVALGVAGYGVVFGVLARQAGLGLGEAVLMSATVLAGAAQLIAVKLWTSPTPAVTVVLTTFVVNLRYVLMGVALRPWFERLSARQAYGSVFFTADENWALTMRRLRDGDDRGAFLLGSGLAIWTFWVVATAVGATAGSVIGDPAAYGLDFVLTAVFLTLAVGLWEGRSNLVPWAAAGGVALLGNAALPGRWYILLGGLAGSAAEVMRRGR